MLIHDKECSLCKQKPTMIVYNFSVEEQRHLCKKCIDWIFEQEN